MISNGVRVAAAYLGLASAALVGCSAGSAPTATAAAGSSNGSGASAGASASGGHAGSSSINVGGSSTGGTGSSNAGGSTSTGGSGSGSSGGTVGSGGTSTGSGGVATEALLPARVRRLTNEEYAGSVKALLGSDLPPDLALPPDTRQDGFTRNESQRVDPVLAKQLDMSAQVLAAAVKLDVGNRAPCDQPDGSEACAQTFLEAFGAQAYRRPLSSTEISDLVALYQLGATGGTYADGIELSVRGILQSAGFLYVTELGDGTAAERIDLTPYEIASSLAYLITAQPPDAQLLQAAEAGTLATPVGRASETLRLIESESGASARVRMLREWIGIDRVLEIGKDSTIYEYFTPAVRTSMDGESVAFLKQVSTVGEVLGADWTYVDRELATYYGIDFPGGDGFQRVTYPDVLRRGILNQGAFLSVYAHASESSPIFRGVSVLKRLVCQPPGSPADAMINVPPAPQPDGDNTTRERFENVHGQNPTCQGCHVTIDAMGFTFENFDGAGKLRLNEDNGRIEENGHPIDSTTSVPPDLGLGISGDFANSGELALALAQSPEVRACFARHVFRSVAAVSGPSVQASEDAYLAAWRANPEAEPGSIVETIVNFVTSPLFVSRRAQ